MAHSSYGIPSPPPDVIESIDPAIREVICSEREFLCTETGRPIYLKDFRSGNRILSIEDNGFYEYTTGSEPTVDDFGGGGPRITPNSAWPTWTGTELWSCCCRLRTRRRLATC